MHDVGVKEKTKTSLSITGLNMKKLSETVK